ncbi:MAG: FapA family protein, partial [Sulfurimonas sp.]|nr:FapA family protein [Sulfurimonas sp.]
MSLAKSYDVNVNTIDFNILEVQTYTRMNDGSKETEWEEIANDEIYELDDATALLNPHFQIKQMYEVEFFTKKSDDPYSNFNLAVGANATKCKVYISIKSGSKVSYSSTFDRELLVLINKAKVRAGILIDIFDEMINEAVSKISAHVRVEEKVKYTKNETILIAESYEPTLTINDEIVLHYDKKENIDEHHKMDYASRGFIKSVEKDEVIIEYIKAKIGKSGRNCRGEFMAAKEPEETNKPTFTIDETIREEDTPKSIKYIANENGYISLEGNLYSVKTDVDLDSITFKTTGNIISGLDSDVSISVTEKDAVKDAIGNGMQVEVTEIDIDGNVGSNAKLLAQRANIGGQTHKTAEVKADKIDINVHKGKAYGKNIHITRLEHGVVDGDEVEITQALGGSIRAKEINIEICASHVKATASKFIEIKKLQGSENVFTIDPLLKKDTQHDLDDNKDDIKNLEKEIKDLKKEEVKYTQLIKNNTASFQDVKKRLIHYKKSGVKLPESFVKKYKQFQKMQETLKNLKESQVLKRNQLEITRSKTSVFQDNIFEARIINRDRWVGYNELIFKLVKPKMDIS